MKKRTKIVVPDFVFPDGREDILMAYLRECGPSGDEPRYVDNLGIFDCNGNYYSMWVDQRSNRARKTATHFIDGHEHNHPISRFCTVSGYVNPNDGYLWAVRPAPDCESESCTLAVVDSHLTFTTFPELLPYLKSIKWEEDPDGKIYFNRRQLGQPNERVYLRDYVVKNLMVYLRNVK
jgi:hypothetical protein